MWERRIALTKCHSVSWLQTSFSEISTWLVPRLLQLYRWKHTTFCVATLSCKTLSCYLTTLSISRLRSVRWRGGPKWSWPERGAIPKFTWSNWKSWKTSVSQCSGRDWNLAPPEDKSKALPPDRALQFRSLNTRLGFWIMLVVWSQLDEWKWNDIHEKQLKNVVSGRISQEQAYDSGQLRVATTVCDNMALE